MLKGNNINCRQNALTYGYSNNSNSYDNNNNNKDKNNNNNDNNANKNDKNLVVIIIEENLYKSLILLVFVANDSL